MREILPQWFLNRLPIMNEPFNNMITAIVALVVFLIVFRIIQKIVIHRLENLAKKTKTDVDDVLIQIVNSLRPPFYFFLSFYGALQFLDITGRIERVLNLILFVWVVYQVITALHILINYLIGKFDKAKGKSSHGAVQAISQLAKYLLWFFGALLILSNLGVNVTSLIAGLGIGGIAIALALQNILGDLFSSFAIYFDKPFEVGDFIVVGKHKGTVTRIGIKTTRVQSLQGEEIVISNKELTSVRIQNYKKMRERRVVITIGVLYQTKTSTLKKIPTIIEEIVAQVKNATFSRAHFAEFGESSLNFEIVYFVKSEKYDTYMDINQEIHFAIKQRFEKMDVEMAYPTRTLYMHKG